MSPAVEAALLDAAERRNASLLERGIGEDEARDRTWACYERAYGENSREMQTRDATFLVELNTIIERGKEE